LPVDHYENFPVASWLLPASLRRPIEAIYGFARGADDLADEGELSAHERLAGLGRYAEALDAIEASQEPEAPFRALARAVAQYRLPVALLRDLIAAFRQDVTQKRYADFAALQHYARRSANPIGRLLLHLFEAEGARPISQGARATYLDRASLEQSDAICSALQFVNFWQDVALDWRKGRVYLPQEDLERFGVAERQIADALADERWRLLMAFECARTRALLVSGAPLGTRLPGRLGLEIRATIAGGAIILDKIEAAAGDVFRHRPVLRASDWIRIIARAAANKTTT